MNPSIQIRISPYSWKQKSKRAKKTESASSGLSGLTDYDFWNFVELYRFVMGLRASSARIRRWETKHKERKGSGREKKIKENNNE